MHRLVQGDCVAVMRDMAAAGQVVQAIVTDPPYHLQSIVKRFGKPGSAPAKSDGETGVYARASAGFMGKQWDGGDVAFDPETWAAALELLPPGGHLAAFSGSRTYHRMACAVEDAGFEIRDQLMWLYGTGFPKSHNVGKKLPEWDGWGTALKPAHEPILLARKPLARTVAATVEAHGTGALNIDATRVAGVKDTPASPRRAAQNQTFGDLSKDPGTGGGWDKNVGRWPANVVHDGSDEVRGCFPEAPGQQGRSVEDGAPQGNQVYGPMRHGGPVHEPRADDDASAARFFYCAKASKAERAGSKHPTVKPVALMRWLVRMVTPPGGVVLDPFAGTGTTGQAAVEEDFGFILVEREDEYVADIEGRLGWIL